MSVELVNMKIDCQLHAQSLNDFVVATEIKTPMTHATHLQILNSISVDLKIPFQIIESKSIHTVLLAWCSVKIGRLNWSSTINQSGPVGIANNKISSIAAAFFYTFLLNTLLAFCYLKRRRFAILFIFYLCVKFWFLFQLISHHFTSVI